MAKHLADNSGDFEGRGQDLLEGHDLATPDTTPALVVYPYQQFRAVLQGVVTLEDYAADTMAHVERQLHRTVQNGGDQ